jgi:hypothetical protein
MPDAAHEDGFELYAADASRPPPNYRANMDPPWQQCIGDGSQRHQPFPAKEAERIATRGVSWRVDIAGLSIRMLVCV